MKIKTNAKFTEQLVRAFLVSIALVVFWNLGSVPVVKADTQNCTPSVNEIALFRDEKFKGPCVNRGIGEYPVLRNLDFAGVSSIKVGANVEALVCGADKYADPCSFIYVDHPSLRDESVGDNTAASVIVRRKTNQLTCHPSEEQVALWEYPYFFGRCTVFHKGAHSDPDIWFPRNPRGFKVGSNMQMQICSAARFRGICSAFRPGYYSHWDERRHEVSAVAVTYKRHTLFCAPTPNQVAFFQYDNHAGGCRLFGVGEYTETETWSDNIISSVKVGANVEATLCWEIQRNGVHRPSPSGCRTFTRSFFNGVRQSDREVTPTLSVRRRGDAAARGDSQPAQPPPPAGINASVWLGANVPFSGLPWWTGRFPTIGTLDGNLTRIANPRNSVWVGFLKHGYGSVDCDNPDAYVLLRPGATMTEDQMSTIFGSRSPALAVQFVVCSGAVGQPTAGGGLTFPALPINITYTRR